MLFLDLDEYLVIRDGNGAPANVLPPPGPDRLRAVLDRHKESAAVTLQWVMVGSSGRETRPDGGGVLRAYTRCASSVSGVFKSIVNMYYLAAGGVHPHNHHYRCGPRSLLSRRCCAFHIRCVRLTATPACRRPLQWDLESAHASCAPRLPSLLSIGSSAGLASDSSSLVPRVCRRCHARWVPLGAVRSRFLTSKLLHTLADSACTR